MAKRSGRKRSSAGTSKQRIGLHIHRLFNSFLDQNRERLGAELNNKIVDLRNLVVRSVRNVLSEPAIAKKLGAGVDSLSLVSFTACESCPPREVVSPPVPWDHVEAEKLDKLLPTIQEFRDQFRGLQDELQSLSCRMSDGHERWGAVDIEELIYRSFFRDLENRPHRVGDMTKIWASVKTEGVIRNRNLPCEICGENRRTDRCHVIPSALGGSADSSNILTLCPTHHALLDAHMLSRGEWDRIDWSRKCEVSQQWASKVLLAGHTDHWERDLPQRPSLLDTRYHRGFAMEFSERLLRLVDSAGGLLQRDVYKHFDQNVRKYLRTLLAGLVDAGLIGREPEKRTHRLFLTTSLEDAIKALDAVRFRF